jgi:hypothetical protein
MPNCVGTSSKSQHKRGVKKSNDKETMATTFAEDVLKSMVASVKQREGESNSIPNSNRNSNLNSNPYSSSNSDSILTLR